VTKNRFSRPIGMGYLNSKKYDGVQYYKKSNGDISYSIRYKDEHGNLKKQR
jgi:hypothetical protein